MQKGPYYGLSRCHTKRMMCMCGCTRPYFSDLKKKNIVERLVSYQKQDGRGQARPPSFGMTPTKAIKDPFV